MTTKLLNHADLTLRAEYFLAYTVVHAKMPISAGDHFVTFSRLADPTSSVLHDMGLRRRTMTGDRNSVASRVKTRWNPITFIQHCVVHKEVLCTKAAVKKLSVFVENLVVTLLIVRQ